jgi:hypothetical protein
MLLMALITAGSAFSQGRQDSAFSLLLNSGLGFTHASDPHINRWLQKYGYPAEPHVPASFNLEIAAIPASSNLLYSVKLSSITSGNNLTSFNLLAGLYTSMIKTRRFLLFLGAGIGYHGDIIRLNGALPAEYAQLAAKYNSPLALRRIGLFVAPELRAFWYPIRINNIQLGVYGGLGYNLDFNSRWRLGYYSNNHGEYGHFRQLIKPGDQLKAGEYGSSFGAGLSVRIHLH